LVTEKKNHPKPKRHKCFFWLFGVASVQGTKKTKRGGVAKKRWGLRLPKKNTTHTPQTKEVAETHWGVEKKKGVKKGTQAGGVSTKKRGSRKKKKKKKMGQKVVGKKRRNKKYAAPSHAGVGAYTTAPGDFF